MNHPLHLTVGKVVTNNGETRWGCDTSVVEMGKYEIDLKAAKWNVYLGK